MTTPNDRAVKAVLFDNDGTLLDTHDLLLESFRHATREVLGTVIPDDVLMARVGTPLAAQMADFTPDAALQQQLVDVYRAYNEAIHDERVRPFPGIPEALEGLAERGVLMGLVTSKRHTLAAHGLEIFGLDAAMGTVVGCDDCARHKPLPDPVLLGCERLGVAPHESLYVGDSPFDIAAGNAAGCKTVAVTWGMFSEDTLRAENPTYVIGHPRELLALV